MTDGYLFRSLSRPGRGEDEPTLAAKSAVADLAKFGRLARHTQKKLLEMGQALRNGSIEADPRKTDRSYCEWCDFRAACRFDETAGDKVRWLKNIKDKEFWEQLEGTTMPKWTPDQQTAIDDRGGALLVSAAAGSGKTAVLTERVLRRLTDENDPVDIDRLLLVTFTNAAAAEMRERIGAALGAAVAANPRDTRLRRQLFLVHRAKITTVHALCLSLAREQAAVLGIAPDFRLMDENEGKLLRAEVLEEVLDTAYEQADEKFFALCDLLTAGRDDKKAGRGHSRNLREDSGASRSAGVP